MIKLYIINGKTINEPSVKGEIQWQTEQRGQPGRLSFNVIADETLNIQEGNPVRLEVNEKKIFFGFIFKKTRDREGIISITAYDQLRYLKNKESYVYSNKTATEIIARIAADFRLNIGILEDTGHKIASRIEDNKSLFEIINNALDLTVQNKGTVYVLYDDFGSLTLKNIESMKVDRLISEATAENYGYTSSIDGETYNRIKLYYGSLEDGERVNYIAKDSSHINQWGVLQYTESINEGENGRAKADALLSLYNSKQRSLTISNAFGDLRIRAGSSLPVYLNVGDVVIQNYMVVEKAVHNFGAEDHRMNLTLKGGVINA